MVDALAAEGMHFDGYEGTGRPGSLGAPVVREERSLMPSGDEQAIRNIEKALWILQERFTTPEEEIDLLALEAKWLVEGSSLEAIALAAALFDICNTVIDELVETKGRLGEESSRDQVVEWLGRILRA